MPKGGQPPRKGWEQRFLDTLEDTHMVSQAVKRAGCSRAFIYTQRRTNPEFAQMWDEVLERDTEVLEQIAVRRAAEGSDQLMMFMLKARRPDVYRENVHHDHDHQHVIDGNVTIELLDGKQPVEISGVNRRAAARRLLHPDAIDSTAEELPPGEELAEAS